MKTKTTKPQAAQTFRKGDEVIFSARWLIKEGYQPDTNRYKIVEGPYVGRCGMPCYSVEGDHSISQVLSEQIERAPLKILAPLRKAVQFIESEDGRTYANVPIKLILAAQEMLDALDDAERAATADGLPVKDQEFLSNLATTSRRAAILAAKGA